MSDLCYDKNGFKLCPCEEASTCHEYQEHLEGMEEEKAVDDGN